MAEYHGVDLNIMNIITNIMAWAGPSLFSVGACRLSFSCETSVDAFVLASLSTYLFLNGAAVCTMDIFSGGGRIREEDFLPAAWIITFLIYGSFFAQKTLRRVTQLALVGLLLLRDGLEVSDSGERIFLILLYCVCNLRSILFPAANPLYIPGLWPVEA